MVDERVERVGKSLEALKMLLSLRSKPMQQALSIKYVGYDSRMGDWSDDLSIGSITAATATSSSTRNMASSPSFSTGFWRRDCPVDVDMGRCDSLCIFMRYIVISALQVKFAVCVA